MPLPRKLTIDQILSEAKKATNQGKIATAIQLYQAILRTHPNHPVAKKNIQKLRQQAPSTKSSSSQTVNPSPDQINHLVNLYQSGKFAEVERHCRQLLQKHLHSEHLHNILGATLRMLGRLEEALESHNKALQLKPDFAEACNNLGLVLQDMGRYEEALQSFDKALQLNPKYAVAHNNRGNTLQKLDRSNDALLCFDKTLQLNPRYEKAHNNRGVTLRKLGRLDAALHSFDRALQLKPGYAEACNNRGNVLRELGRLEEALSNYDQAIQLNPQNAEAYNNRGVTLRALGRLDAAETAYRKVLQLKPDYVEAFTNLLFCLSHSEAIDTQTLFREHCRFGEQFEAHLRANWPQHSNSRNPERCLKVGIVSGDLRNHAVAFFVEPVLAHLAGYPQLSLHAYYNHTIEDNVTRLLRKHFKHWNLIAGLTDEELANNIRKDNIDILIDLSGHTAKHRLLTFARKPVPVQVSWVGYPGTTGLKAMDYRIADNIFLTPGHYDDQFTEKLVYLPASVPFMMLEDAPPVNTLPALANGYITFGSFNRKSKITRSVIALWSKLLHAVPNARMVLGAMPPVGEHNTLIEWFVEEGIDLKRLSFYPKCPMNEYLGLHHQVDLCLDTFPYNGSTTTTHALWMGVPTLTLTGRSIAGRAGASQMGQVGLEEFITQNKTEFVKRGLDWSDNFTKLGSIRNGLRERFRQSALGRPDIIASAFERALRIMWQRWCDRLPAKSFEVPWQ